MFWEILNYEQEPVSSSYYGEDPRICVRAVHKKTKVEFMILIIARRARLAILSIRSIRSFGSDPLTRPSSLHIWQG